MNTQAGSGTDGRWRIRIVESDGQEYQFFHEVDEEIVTLADSLGREEASAEQVRAAFEPYRRRWPVVAQWLDTDDDEEIEAILGGIDGLDVALPGETELERDVLQLGLPGAGYVDPRKLSPGSGCEWLEIKGRDNLEKVMKALSLKYEFVWGW